MSHPQTRDQATDCTDKLQVSNLSSWNVPTNQPSFHTGSTGLVSICEICGQKAGRSDFGCLISVDDDGDLAKLFSGGKAAFRLWSVLKGKGTIQRRSEAALEDQPHDGAEVSLCAHRRAEDREVFAEEVAVVDFESRAARVAHGEDAPAAASGAQAERERARSDIIHHNIHPSATGRLEHGFRPVLLLRAVDQNVRTQVGGELELGLARANDVDSGPGIARHLDASSVHPAGRADDQDTLASLELTAHDQRVPGSVKDEARRRSGLIGESLGQEQNVPGRNDDGFGQRAAHGLAQEMPIPTAIVPSCLAELA